MLSRRSLLQSLALAASPFAFPATRADAQHAKKLVRILLGFAPGGSIDAVARLFAETIKDYGSSAVVENRPGAGGRLALEAVKNSEPDGSWLAATPGDQLTLFPHIDRDLKYDALADFAPIATLCSVSFVLAVGPMVPADVTTLAKFLAWCRLNPKVASFGSPGAGTRPHFLGAALGRAAGVKLVHVPYRGGAAAIQDMLGGQLPALVTTLPNILPHAEGKLLRVLMVTSPQRTARLPDVPTAREAGFADVEAIEWFGLVAPVRTARSTVEDLISQARTVAGASAFRNGLEKLGLEPMFQPGAEFDELIRSDHARWRELIKATGFSPT